MIESATRAADGSMASTERSSASRDDVSNDQVELGFALLQAGRYDEAEPVLREALEAADASGDMPWRELSGLVNGMANVYLDQGKYEETEPLLLRALEGDEAAFGASHPNTSVSVNNLALLYNNQCKYEQAEPLYLRTLEGKEAALGASHPSTLLSVLNLGILHRKQGRPREAEALLRRALLGLQAALGATHQASVCAAMALALLLVQEKHDTSEAAALWRQFGCLVGPQAPETLRSVRELSALLRERGAGASADELDGCFELVSQE